jgi:hypothetical protein
VPMMPSFRLPTNVQDEKATTDEIAAVLPWVTLHPRGRYEAASVMRSDALIVRMIRLASGSPSSR